METRVDTSREAIRGTVAGPADEGHDVARAVRNGMVDKHPAVVVQPVDAAAYPIGLATTGGIISTTKRAYDPANLFRHNQSIVPA